MKRKAGGDAGFYTGVLGMLGDLAIMEKNMETTIYHLGLRFRVRRLSK